MKVAKVVANTDKNRVDVGAKVTVETLDKDGNKVQREYSIVGSAESDPFSGKLSNESPVGRALMGHKKVINSNLPIEEVVVKLIKKANARGGTDNISVAYLKKESGEQ